MTVKPRGHYEIGTTLGACIIVQLYSGPHDNEEYIRPLLSLLFC